MAEYLVKDTSLTAIADAIRSKTGLTGTLTLDGMIDAANSIEPASDPVLQSKTVTPSTSFQTVTPDSGYDGLSEVTVNAMPTATQATPTVSIDSAGKITATATQTAGYVSAGTKTGTKQLTTQAAKTITPSTSSQTAVANGVYTTGAVTVAAVPTQTKSVTPSASSQDVTADSGKFLSKVTVSGDENLTAENIKSGVSIFGVDGTLSGNDTPTNVTLNFSWTATSSNYAPEVFYSHINKNNSKLIGGTYIAPSTTGSTTLTVAKNSIIVIICRNTTSSFYGVTSYSASDGIVSLPNSYIGDARHGNSLFLINNNGDLTVSIGHNDSGGGGND